MIKLHRFYSSIRKVLGQLGNLGLYTPGKIVLNGGELGQRQAILPASMAPYEAKLEWNSLVMFLPQNKS